MVAHVAVRPERNGRLTEIGILASYLPAHCPELNAIETGFGVIKSTEMPERTYPAVVARLDAVNGGFARRESRLLDEARRQLRPAVLAP